MKFYIKNASGEEETISVANAIVRTGYNFETKNDTIDIYDEHDPIVLNNPKLSIELSEGVSITITKK